MGGLGGMAAALTVLVQAKGVGAVNAQLAGIDANLKKTGVGAGKFGMALKRGLMIGGAAVLAVIGALGKLGSAFDDAYDSIRVGTGKSGKALDGLKKDFKEVVKGVPTDFKSASEAITELNRRLGLTGRPLQRSAKQFLELSRITGTDVKTNIQTVTRAFGDWEVKTGDQAATLDKFFRASQSSGASVGDLAKQVVQFGAPLRQMGFSLDEATAMFASFEKAGVNTSTMMPGLKMALKTFLAEGIDPKQGLMKTFKGIKDGSITASDALKIFGTRAGPDMVEAIQQGRFSLADMTKTLVNGKDTIRAAGKDTMDFSEKWQMFKNKVLVALEPIATRIFNFLGSAMDALAKVNLSGVVGWFKDLFKGLNNVGDSSSSLGVVIGVLGDAFKTGLGFVRSVTERVLPAVVQIFEGFAKAISGVIDVLAGIFTLDFGRIWTGVKKIFSGGIEAVWGIMRAATATFRELAARLGNAIIEGLKSLPRAFEAAGTWVVNRVVDGFKTVTTGLGNVGEWLKNRVGEFVRGIPDGFVNIGTWVVNRVVDGFKTVTEGLGNIGQWLLNRIGEFARGAKDGFIGIGGSIVGFIVSGIKSAFTGAVNLVIDFANKIIGVINKIPGVDIGKIEKLATGGKVSSRGVDTETVEMLARGGKITRPMAIVGEEAPRHPEWVIPSNPAYRDRALGLFGQLGSKLGVPGYAKGGVLGDSVGGPLDVVGDVLSTVGKATSPLSGLLGKGAGWFIDQLPGVGDLPGWLAGMGKYVLDKAASYIKDQVSNFATTRIVDAKGIAANWTGVQALASRLGLTMTSGYRPGDPGWHGQNRARDYSNSSGPTPEMMAFARAMLGQSSGLLELIYGPLGVGVKNGQVVSDSVFADVLANHFNHVHVAMAKGGMLHRDGWTLDSYQQGTNYVPQTGPYLLHKGEAVTPASQNKGGGDVIVQGNLVIREEADADRIAGRLAWLMASAG